MPRITPLQQRWQQTMTTLPARTRLAARDALATALACALSWFLAQRIWGHPHPTFAVVTAIVCLAPGVPSHLKQTKNLLIGCTLGIVLGELMWQMPDAHPLVRLGLGSFFSILLGTVIGPAPMVPIQAGVSMVLVLAMGPSNAGSARLLDVLVGAAVGVLFSQVLFTSNAFKDMGRAATVFLKQIANGLDAGLRACQAQDARASESAMGQLAAASDSLAALRAAVTQAQDSRRWTLRGRLHADRLAFVSRRYDRHAVRVYATALLLAEGTSRATSHTQTPPPAALAAYSHWLADACKQLANQPTVVALGAREPLAQMPQRPADTELDPAALAALAPEWRQAYDNAEQLEQALRALIASRDA